ncbi:hypothetical protein WJX81_006363 [Elliptochloris bilobata]|uniref:NAD(P)-binding domain-containing protein n=1 Tax=Elliptochloris bilobata TaxID=381761 RepID=A0AAW1SHJ9_9CHLO
MAVQQGSNVKGRLTVALVVAGICAAAAAVAVPVLLPGHRPTQVEQTDSGKAQPGFVKKAQRLGRCGQSIMGDMLATGLQASGARTRTPLAAANRPCWCSRHFQRSRQLHRQILRPRGQYEDNRYITVTSTTEDWTPSDSEVVPLNTGPAGAALGEPSGGFTGLRAVVAGATGGTGRAIVARLAAEGVPVRALVRNVAAAATVLPGLDRSVELLPADVYQYATLPRALGDANAMIIATGTRAALDPFGPYNVDYQGVVNLVTAAQRQGRVQRIVLVSSIGADDPFFPLNALWGVLFWKKRGEEAVQRSGIPYTIVRPGGLLDAPRPGTAVGGIVMAGPNAFGLPPRRLPGSILRSQVADVCVEALALREAEDKVLIAGTELR